MKEATIIKIWNYNWKWKKFNFKIFEKDKLSIKKIYPIINILKQDNDLKRNDLLA